LQHLGLLILDDGLDDGSPALTRRLARRLLVSPSVTTMSGRLCAEWMKWNRIKNVNVWCFSPCILEVDAADAVFSQTHHVSLPLGGVQWWIPSEARNNKYWIWQHTVRKTRKPAATTSGITNLRQNYYLLSNRKKLFCLHFVGI